MPSFSRADMNIDRRYKLLIMLAIAVYAVGLFGGVMGDAGTYASLAREIYTSGDWINLKIHGEPYMQKPPLLFWLGAASFHIFGVSLFAFKFPVFLVSLVGVYATYRLAKIWYGRQIGQVAALILLFSEIYFLFNNDIHTDTILTSFNTFTLWQLSEYIQQKKWKNLLLGFTGVGLTVMSKGPIGAFVPVTAVLCHLIYKRDFKTLFSPRWLTGIPIVAIIILPALWGLFNQFGIQGIRFFFWGNIIGRITGTYTGNNNDYSFYLHTSAYLLAPWSVLTFIAFFMEVKARMKKKQLETELFLLGGIVPYLLIVSMAKAKSPQYLFIIAPLILIITAKWIMYSIENIKMYRVAKYCQDGIIIILYGLVLVFVFYLFPTRNLLLLLTILSLFLLTIYFRYTLPHGLNRLLLPSMVGIIAFVFTVNIHVLPNMFKYQASIPVANILNNEYKKGETVFSFGYRYDDQFFYPNPTVTKLKDKQELMDIFNKRGIWLFTDQEGYEFVKKKHAQFDKIYQFDNYYLSRLSLKFLRPETRASKLSKIYLLHWN